MKLIERYGKEIEKRLKKDQKQIENRSKRDRICWNSIEKDQKLQYILIFWLNLTFLMDFDFFDLLIDIKVIFFWFFNQKEIEIVQNQWKRDQI